METSAVLQRLGVVNTIDREVYRRRPSRADFLGERRSSIRRFPYQFQLIMDIIFNTSDKLLIYSSRHTNNQLVAFSVVIIATCMLSADRNQGRGEHAPYFVLDVA